jgi:hypothetical protein
MWVLRTVHRGDTLVERRFERGGDALACMEADVDVIHALRLGRCQRLPSGAVLVTINARSSWRTHHDGDGRRRYVFTLGEENGSGAG